MREGGAETLMRKTGCLGVVGRIGMVVADFDDTCTQGDTIGILMDTCINAAALVRAPLCRWGDMPRAGGQCTTGLHTACTE